MTTTGRVSDRTLRRAAWVATAFLPTAVLVSVPVVARARAVDPSWNGGLVGDTAFVLVLLSFPLAGLLVLRRQPRNRVAWLLEGIGLIWGLGVITDVYSAYGLLVAPGVLPGASVVAGATAGSWALGIGVMGTFLILLFPDGRLPSPRWRPVAWVAGVSMVMVTVIIAFLPGKLAESAVPTLDNPLGSERAEPVLSVLLVVFLPLIPLSILACAVALVLRFRRSTGVERLQLKWLASAGVVVAVLYVTTMATTLAIDAPFQDPNGQWVLALQTLSILSFVLLPTAIAIAVLRHRLYGIDTVINRTLVYGALTVTLAAVYIGSVLLLQLLLSSFTSQSDLAIAASTLTVAALFGPVRTRIQSAVDRRFYRSRYDAARTLEGFTTRLRHEVDLDAVSSDLCSAAEQTLQPTHVTLWLRP
jgi:MFS family permease